MIERQELYRRHCVRKVIEVVETVPDLWRTKTPIILDQATAALLLLKSWLQSGRHFLFQCLEEIEVDPADLSRRVDIALDDRKIPTENLPHEPPSPYDGLTVLRDLIAQWLDRAAEEAQLLRQDYLGIEHLLLAFLRPERSPIAPLLLHAGLDHRRLTQSVLDALRRGPSSSGEPSQAPSLESGDNPIPEAWQAPATAVGMPRRFSIAIMMAWMTLFAGAFSVLKWVSAPPEVFGIVTIFMLSIGLAQMWLFGGNRPRLASIVAGAVTLPVEAVILSLITNDFTNHSGPLIRILVSIVLIIPSIPVGVLFGYLLGGLTAGIVLTLNYLENRNNAPAPAQPQSHVPLPNPNQDKAEFVRRLGRNCREAPPAEK